MIKKMLLRFLLCYITFIMTLGEIFISSFNNKINLGVELHPPTLNVEKISRKKKINSHCNGYDIIFQQLQ